MENKIRTLFYNFKEKDIKGIHNEIENIGYSIVPKLVSELGELKAEIIHSEWDIIVVDHESNNSTTEEILDFVKDLDQDASIVIVSQKIDSEMAKLVFKSSRNDIISKTDNAQIGLTIIRNYEKLKAINQLEFTKKELLRSQQSQNEQHNFLNQVIESTENPIFYKGTGGRYLGCNEAFARFIGLPKNKIIGKTVFEVAPKELAKKYKDMDDEFFRNPVVQKYEYKAAHSDGHTMDILFHKSPLKDEKGNIIGLLGHMFDVTDNQKVEQALKASEQKYKLLVESMQEGIVIADLNEVVVYNNIAFDRIFGCEPGEMIGQNLKNYIVEEDIPKVLQQTLRKKENLVSSYKLEIIRKDKKRRILNVSSVPWKNEKNELLGSFGTIMDITAQEYSTKGLEKRIKIEQSIIKISSQFISSENFEEKLHKALNGLRDIIDAQRYGILTIQDSKIKLEIDINHGNDGNGKNKFKEESYQVFQHSLKMLETFDFIFYDDVENMPDTAVAEKEVLKNNNIFNFLGIPFYYGTHRSGLIIISNIYEVDEWTIEELSLLRTISTVIANAFESKQAEDKIKQLNLNLVTKNEELEQVVYVTSHDIRSPVVNILGFSDEMIKAINKLAEKIFNESNIIQNKEEIEYLLKNDVPQILNFIKISGQKIDKLLLALLKLSRLGRAAINKVNVDMNDLMKRVINNFEFVIKENKISVQVDNLLDCYSDEVAINQMFSNLIDNSIKYRSLERDIQIKISCKSEDTNVTYCIEDNGIGIPEKEIDKIFDVFYRIDPENQKGEGIGLSLIKKIVERLDGKISVGSKEGEGTKFFISLERAKS